MFFERGSAGTRAHLNGGEDAHEHLLESFEIPVLINDCMDHSCEENLLRFVSKQIHEVMHFVDLIKVSHVLLAPLGKQLLTKKEHQVLDILVVGEVDVLSGVGKAHLDLIHQGPAH